MPNPNLPLPPRHHYPPISYFFPKAQQQAQTLDLRPRRRYQTGPPQREVVAVWPVQAVMSHLSYADR